MATKKTFGLFWDQHTVHFAENSDNVPKIFHYPTNLGKVLAAMSTKETTEGIKFTELLQRILLENKITTRSVQLSLPSHDIIFRSFIIPWMQSSEMKGVVEFEASKYVPFELDKLAYNYLSITLFKEKRKQILILFVAIRKDVLENYCNVLEHSDLKVELTEPGQISLLRFLAFKKILPRNKTVAVIDTDAVSGRIMIIEKEVPQFIREFQLAHIGAENPKEAPDALQAKLFNEARMSLDFYSRQYVATKIDQILYISLNDSHQISDSLTKYLNIPTQNVNIAKTLSEAISDIGSIKAFGVTLRNAVLPNMNFDLTLKKPTAADEDLTEEPTMNYPTIAITVCLCLAFLFGVHKLSQDRRTSYQEKIQTITKELGTYESSSAKMIKEQTADIQAKLGTYKNLRVHGRLSIFLTLLSKLVPEGIWVNDLTLTYRNDNNPGMITVSFNGYVYNENPGQQIATINRFIDSLKADKNFSSFFKAIDLVTANKQDLKGYRVTSFTIACQ